MEDTLSLQASLCGSVDISFQPEEDSQCDFFSSPGMEAIFSQGMVITESRIEDSVQTCIPEIFANSLIKKNEDYQKHISNTSMQKQLFIDSANAATETVICGYHYNTTKPVSVLDQISNTIMKSTLLSVNIMKQKFFLPKIVDNELNKFNSEILGYIHILLKEVAISVNIGRKSLNVEATLERLYSIANKLDPRLSPNKQRMESYRRLLVVLLLEDYLIHSRKKIVSLFHYSTLNSTSSGDILHVVDHSSDTVKNRQKSMITTNVSSVALNVTYNLKFRQMQNLLLYIYSPDCHIRLQAKVDLLSTIPIAIRSDLINSPLKVLEKSFSEHLMTREEILHFCFFPCNSGMNTRRCPKCNTIVSIEANYVSHTPCQITDWLVSTFQFVFNQDRLTAPFAMYVNGCQSNYIRDLILLDSKLKQSPLVSESTDNFRIFTTGPNGKITTTGNIGIKHVRLKGN